MMLFAAIHALFTLLPPHCRDAFIHALLILTLATRRYCRRRCRFCLLLTFFLRHVAFDGFRHADASLLFMLFDAFALLMPLRRLRHDAADAAISLPS